MKRRISTLLVAGLFALTGRVMAEEVRNPGIFVHLTTRGWFTFDPAASFDAVSFIVTGNVYEPLIVFKGLQEADSFEPFLASQVPTRENGLISEDETVYRFPIRKKVRFHGGERLTPEDVRYSLLRFMLNDVEGGPSALLLKPILGIYSTRDSRGDVTVDFDEASAAVAVEGDEVVIRLAAPDATFLKRLASLPIIVSKKWCVKNGEWDGTRKTWKRYNGRPMSESYLHTRINGTGPFRLKSADKEGGFLELRRHKKYWRETASLEGVILRVVASKAMRLMMLENGDADASYLEDRDFRDASELSGVRIVDDLPMATLGEVLFFTFKTDPDSKLLGSGKLDGKGIPADFFGDRHVREAFAYALDYEGYHRRGMAARGRRAVGPIPDFLLPRTSEARYTHDPKKAKRAFKKAFGGKLWKKGFTLDLAYSPSNASRHCLAEVLRAGLEKINPKFRVRIKTMSSSVLYQEAENHRLPLFIAGYYADYPDPHSYAFGMLHSSGYYPKAQRYSNGDIDALIDKASGVSDPEERIALYRKITEMAAEDLAQIYTYLPQRFIAGREWVRGMDADQNINNLNLNSFPYFYALSKG